MPTLPGQDSQAEGCSGRDMTPTEGLLEELGTDSIPGSEKSPGGGHSNPLQDSCLENPHGQRSLVGYSPWDHKESDTTESTYHARMEGKSTSGRHTSK